MNMKNRLYFVIAPLLALGLTTAPTPSLAQIPEIEFAVLGGANVHMISRSDDSLLPSTVTGGTSWLLGASAGLGSFETGLLISRKTLVDQDTESGSWSSIDIPVLYRFGFWPVTLGTGVFASIPIGSNTAETSYGILFGPRVYLPGGILLDARFAWGLTQESLKTASSSLQLMLGYSFF
jgi:hypothetical protein